MAYPIEINQLAQEEYINAYTWYEDEQPELGKRFMNEVEKTLKLIAEYPLRFAKVHLDNRKAVVENFPYIIVFQYYPRLKTIYVASIRHMKRGKRGQYRKRRRQ